MEKFKFGKVLGVLLLVVVFWILIGFNHFNGENGEEMVDSKPIVDYDTVIDNKNYITSVDNFYAELKKEDEKRLIEEHKKRMKRVEQEQLRQQELERQRLAKIEAEKKRKAEELKKKQQELHNKTKQVSNKQSVNTSGGGWRTFEATAYTSYCTGCTGQTASGIWVRDSIYYKGYRVIAVDPKVIPLWSIVEVKTPFETFKALALDTGGSIKNFRVDLLMKDKSTAYSFGRRNVQMRVLGKFK